MSNSPTFDLASLCINIGEVKFYVTQDSSEPTPYASLDRLLDTLESDVDYSHYCERDYTLWENNVAAPILEKHGFMHGRFRSAESDSFGPLSRCVPIFFGQQAIALYYG